MKPRNVRISTRTAVSLATCLLVQPASASAQDLPARGDAELSVPSATRTYGTGDDIVEVVYGFDMDPFSGAVAVGTAAGARVCTSACGLLGGVHLPAGALVKHIELEACDPSPTQQVAFALFRRDSPGGLATNLTGFVTTGLAETPGCDFFGRNVPGTEVVSNERSVYFVEVVSHSSVNFTAVRVYYRLQVSPAPGTATFPIDVPTSHPFFRFVEALAAAGISGGCAAGSFCPDAAVTRGQMAVFLATALGLHFPN